MIYLDSSVALAYLLAEDRCPSNALCSEPGPEEWLLIEWPEGEEEPTKYWL